MNIAELKETIQHDANANNNINRNEAGALWEYWVESTNTGTNKNAKAIINAFVERYNLKKPETQGEWLALAQYALRANYLGINYDDDQDSNYICWASNRLDDELNSLPNNA